MAGDVGWALPTAIQFHAFGVKKKWWADSIPWAMPTAIQFHAFGVMMARKKKNFLEDLSNSGPPFDYMVKAGQTARPKTIKRRLRNNAAIFGCWLPS